MVVDNGSTDETPQRLAELGWVRVLTLPENRGFVRGNNAGIEAATATDPSSDIVLLNNDLVFTQRDWLTRLRACAGSAPDVGVVGCRLVFPDGRLLHAGTYILADTIWGQQIGAMREGHRPVHPRPRRRGDRLRLRLHPPRADRPDRRLGSRLPELLRGHRLLPAGARGRLQHAGVRRRHPGARRARLDAERSQGADAHLPGEPRRLPPKMGSEARRALPARDPLAVDHELPLRLLDELPRVRARPRGRRGAHALPVSLRPEDGLPHPRARGEPRLPARRHPLPQSGREARRRRRLRPGRLLLPQPRAVQSGLYHAGGRRLPPRLGAPGQRDGRGVGPLGVQPRRLPPLRPQEAGPCHPARRRHRLLPSRRHRLAQPGRRVRLPLPFRVGRAQGALAPPQGVQRGVLGARAGAAPAARS